MECCYNSSSKTRNVFQKVSWQRQGPPFKRPKLSKLSKQPATTDETTRDRKQKARQLSHRMWKANRSRVRKLKNLKKISVNSFIHRVDNFQAGSISKCYHHWRKITSNKWVLNLVKGYSIEFVDEPYQVFRPKPLRLNDSCQRLLDGALNEFLHLGIIEPCNYHEYGFYSTLFPIAKKDKSARIIFDLSKLNEFIYADHFKMDTVKQAIELINPGSFFASVDFKHAYYSVSISENDRKYLRFVWQGKAYQFAVMAQGLCTAPRAYTKLLKPVFAFLRKQGFTVLGYIDDTLFIENSSEDIMNALHKATRLFDSLGLTISVNKSVLEPVQKIEYLGFVLNSMNMTVSLTVVKKNKIRSLARKLLNLVKFPIRLLCSFIGNVVAAEPGVYMAAYFYKKLELQRNIALNENYGDFDAIMFNNEIIKSELKWWHGNIMTSRKAILDPPVDLILYSDASKKGWGGHTVDKNSTGGDWTQEEQEKHINQLELRAAFLTMQSFCSQLSNIHVRLMMDNTTAIACINNFGSMKDYLMEETDLVYKWALERKIHLSSAYIPGVENLLADKESRTHNVDMEWQLNKTWFNYIVKQFGQPDIDLFASRINKQLDCYVSWRPDPHAKFVDAFSRSWARFYPYIFPPFSVISRILRKVEIERVDVILVFPKWPNQLWYPRLQRLMISDPIPIPGTALVLPQDRTRIHPLCKTLHLQACRLSGRNIVAKD